MKYALVPSTKHDLSACPAISDEARLLKIRAEQLLADYYKPISTRWANPALRFLDLKDEWERDTATLSSITEIAMHPAYQQIIGIGPVAISLILYEMGKKPNHWFWALKSITGEDPVPPEARGNIGDMTEAWLSWGREQRYLP
jgi:hypothetical protein